MTTLVSTQVDAPATSKKQAKRAFTVIENIKGERHPITPPDYVNDETINLSANSIKVLEKRYLRRDLDGSYLESVAGMFYRIAYHIAQVEKQHDGDAAALSKVFYHLLTEKRFFPNSPTFTGAGTPLGQLAACFVLPIADDMGKESDGIFSTLRVAALIQQTGGGNGFSFSRLRPKNDVVLTSAGRATGPVGFLRVYDQAFGEIAQGGSRRGANMGVLRVDHPDIEEFISCKAEEGKIANFNISVAITDEFMRAVKDDSEFTLRNPRNGQVWKKLRARDLFKKIVKYAHHNGEPGALFIDAANRTNPVPHLYQLEATNPCGEQWLGPYENCCLGSINLAVHVTSDAQGKRTVDWELLRRSIYESTHFLDNVVSANAYVPAVPEVARAAYNSRRIGLGIMGLSDMMYELGIRYGSEEGQEFAAQIMEFVRYHCMEKSVELAKERGAFLAYPGSIYDPNQEGGMKWRVPSPIKSYKRNWQRPPLDWGQIVNDIQQYGIRNAAQTTVAPTGTIATVIGCEGYGCEPVFALGYVRHFKDGDRDVELLYTSPLFEQALNAADLSESHKQEIKEYVGAYGSCQQRDDLPEQLRHAFVVSSDISAEEHVLMQAAIQAFVDNSISKCLVGDTLLLTGQGLVALQDLSDLRAPDQFESLERDIVSPAGVEKSDAFYYGGYRETRKLTLRYGYEIEGTTNHRIHALNEKGEIQFRQLSEFKPGDTVVLYGNQRSYGKAQQALPVYSSAFADNSKRMVFPARMSEDLAFMLGCITSAGAITQNGLSITSNDVAVLEKLNLISQELFQVQGVISQDKRNDVHSLQIHSRPLRNWLLADLRLEAGAEDKNIPGCILGASLLEIAAFLRGLFLDGYRTLDGKLSGITRASKRLVRQLQTLLLNMGVLATIRQTSERGWALTVQGGALETLAEQIGFVEVWKNERMGQRNLGSVQRTRLNVLAGHRVERGDALRLDDFLRQETLDPSATAFFGHDNEQKIYLEVQSAEVGYAEVFDISVPGSHSFIANGMGNHNTCNFPEGASEEDVAKAYLLAWELGCKGLTVYVTGSRQQVVLETKATREKKGETAVAGAESGAASSGVNGYGTTAHGINGAHNAATSGNELRPVFVKRPRPHVLRGNTYRKDTPLGAAYITINSDEHEEPFEVFLNVGKAGSDVSAVSEAIGRLMSLVLRMPSNLPPNERMEWMIDEMAGIGGGRPMGFGANRVRSLPDGIAQVLSEHLSNLPPSSEAPQADQLALPILNRPIGDICPECGEATFLNIEGCKKCQSCGYSEC
jgi:adenosylcobalamin-dependent ribonucleoside-diphosphate reductase